jgi:hypothetical protein
LQLTPACSAACNHPHTDCNGVTSSAAVTLKYVAPPRAVADTYSYPGGSFTLVDSAATRGILFNDVNPSCPGTPLTPAVTNPTTKGTIALTTNGGFTYVPNANVAPGEAARLILRKYLAEKQMLHMHGALCFARLQPQS